MSNLNTFWVDGYDDDALCYAHHAQDLIHKLEQSIAELEAALRYFTDAADLDLVNDPDLSAMQKLHDAYDNARRVLSGENKNRNE
jgi:exonuclease VII small subunit